ncbi:MAG: HD domain-containing protein [Candidatus Aureabacteria bacterium]|nr:HD domain-containing protein [Candidatus Auribacterota bacterium]
MINEPYIEEISDADIKKQYPIRDGISFGRGIDCTVCLNYPEISRRHSEILFKDDKYIIKDLGSTNGTFVNHKRTSKKALSHGDRISIATHSFTFYSGISDEDISVLKEEELEDTALPNFEITDINESQNKLFSDEVSQSDLKILQKNFQALTLTIKAFTTKDNIDELLNNIAKEILELIPAHNCAILIKDERDLLTLKVHHMSNKTNEKFSYSKSIIKNVSKQKKPLLIVDTGKEQDLKFEQSIINYKIKSVMCAPLIYLDEFLGVIYLDTHGVIEYFNRNGLKLLDSIASVASGAIYNSMLISKLKKQTSTLQNINYRIMFTLANAIEARDHYTAGHAWRVTRFSEIIGRQLGWTEEKLKSLRIGGVLHDIGKIAIPDYVIIKPSRLTVEEFEIIKTHPKRGALILKEANCLEEAIPFILYHHERFDGKGYPYQLKEDAIPIEGRMLAIADTFDALTSDRPYRKAIPPHDAVNVIKENSGTQFDPEIVEIFCKAYDSGLINDIIDNYYSSQKTFNCPFCSTVISAPSDSKDGDILICLICEHEYQLFHDDSGFSAKRIKR